MSGLHRASKIIAAVWFLALITAIPYAVCTEVLFQVHPNTNETIPESAFCTVNPSKTPSYLFESSTFLFFLIPMIIMVILYVRMGFAIHKQHSHRNTAALGRQTSSYRGQHATNRNDSGERRRPSQSKKAILKMLAAVVIAFFICWAPFHTQRLMYIAYYDYGWKFVNEPTYHYINEKLYYVTGCFYYFSSTVNPILYNLLSVKYRNAFKEAICGVGNRDDQALYRSSLHAQPSTYSTNRSIRSPLVRRNLNNCEIDDHPDTASVGFRLAQTPITKNGLLSIETIELGIHSRNSSVSDGESRHVTFHNCPCKEKQCEIKNGLSFHGTEKNCQCKKEVQ